MDVGEVIREALRLYRRFFLQFFLTALLVFVVLDLLTAIANSAGATSFFWNIVAIVVSFVGYFWVQAALVEMVRDVRDGRADRTISETFATVQPRLAPVMLAGLGAGIGIGIGFVLLVVPGLILLTIWSMITPVIVIEGRTAGESFGRSRQIVRGNGWSVFGLIISTFLIVWIATAVIGVAFRPLPAFPQVWLSGLVAHSLTVPFLAAALTTAYFRLTGSERAAVAPQV